MAGLETATSGPASGNTLIIDGRVERASRWLAERTPRRSFIGYVGRASLAAAGGGALAATLFKETAFAITCGCGGDGNSVTCNCLAGSTNSCPNGTCQCGAWVDCNQSAPCYPKKTRYTDCCDLSGCATQCVDGCGQYPKCCNKREHSAGTCGVVNQTIIRCRLRECLTNC